MERGNKENVTKALPTSSDIGALLRKRRESWGVTQVQIASELGIRHNAFARWERGEINFTAVQLIHWCAELKLCVTIAPLK